MLADQAALAEPSEEFVCSQLRLIVLLDQDFREAPLSVMSLEIYHDGIPFSSIGITSQYRQPSLFPLDNVLAHSSSWNRDCVAVPSWMILTRKFGREANVEQSKVKTP
jgi:hypothetical protein